ncbi:MAG: prepilin-type N-terminal cleavage/methylation domain-containing protein [Microgenomates group bacterium]
MINNMRRGFTLIELLVVITIISILTIVTVSQFSTAKKKANDVARKGDLNGVSKALQMYFTDYGFFPVKEAIDLTTGGTFVDASNPPYVYMKKMPVENYLTAYPYCYKVDTAINPKKYGLFAQLENTSDHECSGSYSCGGRTYCYGVVSPNTSLEEVSGY